MGNEHRTLWNMLECSRMLENNLETVEAVLTAGGTGILVRGAGRSLSTCISGTNV
jgi:hypothetical protein